MKKDIHPTSEEHQDQINAYAKKYPTYKIYALALQRVLEKGCHPAFPGVVVQARPKSVSSFAEKVVRKYAKHPDAVNQFTDLCAARIILQTLEQVRATGQFIESNFRILEKDDKSTLLDENEFGYREMHYIIRLSPDTAPALGLTPEEITTIGELRAEVQVRTWLQHAWADTLHDRVYKTPIHIPKDLVRMGNLQAALMEEADRNFDTMARKIDGMHSNYACSAQKSDIQEEIKTLQLILKNEPNEEKKPTLALKLAQLHTVCGKYAEVAHLLTPFLDHPTAGNCKLKQEIGNALCSIAVDQPASERYKKGIVLLEESVALYCNDKCPYAHDIQKQKGLHARALSRLAKAYEIMPNEQQSALQCRQKSHEIEPENPYHLADMLFQEIGVTQSKLMATTTKTLIRKGITASHEHAENNIQLPLSLFTAARLSLLLDETYQALGYYCRALLYTRTEGNCFANDIPEREIWLLMRLQSTGIKLPEIDQALELFRLMQSAPPLQSKNSAAYPKAIIVTGGAAHCSDSTVNQAKGLLEGVFSCYSGLVISGGTRSGIPGAAGDAAQKLSASGQREFKLISYIPDHLPVHAPRHSAYDEHIVCGSRFSPTQVLQYWNDLLQQGLRPHEVYCLGFGGGAIARFEYQLCLALGASVFITQTSEGSADEMLADSLWNRLPNLYPIPADPASFRMLVTAPEYRIDDESLEEMAQEFHTRYIEQHGDGFAAPFKPWAKLENTYKNANITQARYAIEILKENGFGVRPSTDDPTLFSFDEFEQQVEAMAEMEHGRWNIDRLKAGWRPGKKRDDETQINTCIIPWKQLSEELKSFDRNAVLAFPRILKKAGLEVFRISEI